MGIVQGKSTTFGKISDTGRYQGPSGASAKGKTIRVAGTVDCAAEDSNGSTYDIVEIPSSYILLPGSAMHTTAWGFAQAVFGADGVTDALLDVTKATGGATGNGLVTIFDAKWNKPIWQQLGLAEDPGVVTLKVFAEADATIDGQIKFDLQFANHV